MKINFFLPFFLSLTNPPKPPKLQLLQTSSKPQKNLTKKQTRKKKKLYILKKTPKNHKKVNPLKKK